MKVSILKTAHVNDTRIAYQEYGPAEGTPVVLSHSLFFDHTMFEPLAAILAGKGFRVIAYDHRGQGNSAAAPREQLAVDQLTEDAAAFIRQLDLGRVHFVGNSLGGFVALRLAARHPGLLLTCTAVGSSAEQEYAVDAFAPLAEQLSVNGAKTLVGAILHIMFGDATLKNGGPLIEHWHSFISALGPSIGDCAYQVIYRKRIVEELAGCHVPMLAIAGNEDHAYPPPISSDNIAKAAGGTSVVVEGAGHSVSLECPEAVANHLLRHFAAVTEAA